MPNLDVKVLRYMSNEEFRVLTAVEMGMRNHEIVPGPLIESVSGLKRGGAFKLIRLLAKNKLVAHQSKPYDGYRLTSKGYDYLALKTLCKRGAIAAVGIQIGVGKESDIFTAVRPDGEEVALKLHKLGRSFRTLRNNRDYTRPGQAFNWLYMSRLSALKEFAFMSALHEKGFSVPTPIDVNRHCVVMSLAHGYQLNSIQVLRHPSTVFNSLMELICQLASYGLIHCDFNEFNMLVDDNEKVTLIDFPQMISTSHPNADYYFNRDVECVRTFFRRRFGFEAVQVPTLEADTSRGEHALDEQLAASGWTPAQASDFSAVAEALAEGRRENDNIEGGSEVDSDSGSECEINDESGEEEDRQEEDSEGAPDKAASLEKQPVRRETMYGTSERGNDDPSKNLCEEMVAASVDDGDRSGAPPELPKADTDAEVMGSKNGACADCLNVEALGSSVRADVEETKVRGGGESGVHDGDDEDELPIFNNRGVPVHAGQLHEDREVTRLRQAAGTRPTSARGAEARVAERVKQELRRKNSQRQPKGGSRNQGKNREQRKLAASVKREVSGTGGW